MKEKVDQNLYFVDKILRIEQVNGQKYAVVKWENYSYRQTSRQTLESLKINPLLCNDLQRLQAQYQVRHQTRAIAHQIGQYTDNYLHQIYDCDPLAAKQSTAASTDGRNEIREKQKSIQFQVKKNLKQKSELTPQQLVICNLKAKNNVKERVKYGLGNFGPSQYFQLSEILQDLSQKLRKMDPQDLPATDLVVQEVKGVYQQNEGYRFCVCVDSRVIAVALEQMLQVFPKSLYNFLIKFLRYMHEKMQQQIRKEGEAILGKRHKAKAIQAVSKLLNIRQHIQSHKKMVYFGRNQEDVELNIRLHQLRFKGESNRGDQTHSSDKIKSKTGSDSQITRQAVNLSQDLKALYNQVELQIDIIERQNSGVYQRPKSHQTKSAKSYRLQLNDKSPARSSSKNSKQLSESVYADDSVHSGDDSKESKKKAPSRGRKMNQSYPTETETQLRRSSRISSKSNTVKSVSNEEQRQEESEQGVKRGRRGGSCLKRKGQVQEQQWGRKKVFKKN